MSAQTLVQCINQFALKDINPVITVLPDNGVLEFDRKYPQPMLTFSGLGLRAYYHCHTSASRPEIEHGHFHVFIKTDNEEWSHLAGLSMDNLGQPIQWFTVNHWVTGEKWITADILERQLEKLLMGNKHELMLVEKWLLAMLEFYQQSLNHLLQERDQKINSLLAQKKLEAVLKDHVIYDLSQTKINLLNDLESCANLNELENYHN